jgi:D-galactarolactone cycloisomerase
MKITRIEPILIALPYDHGAPKPLQGAGVREVIDSLFVRVETDAGITGWGEAFSNAAGPITRSALETIVPRLAIGRDINDIPVLMTDLDRRMQSMTRNGPVAFALSGLDIALWDIAGKAAGVPVWKLLGGDGKRNHIPAYASLMRLETDEHVTKVVSSALKSGYRHIKLHEHTASAVAAARKACGPDISLMVDVNCHWTTPEDALKAARAFAPYNPTWFEEPLYPPDDLEGLAHIRAAAGMPIAGGENMGCFLDIKRMIDSGAADIVQASIAKMGGITAMRRAVAYAEEKGAKLVPHSPYVGMGLIASLHVMAAMPGAVVAEHRNCDLEASPIGNWVRAEDGYLRVPNGPGLGVEPDLAVLEKYRIR